MNLRRLFKTSENSVGDREGGWGDRAHTMRKERDKSQNREDGGAGEGGEKGGGARFKERREGRRGREEVRPPRRTLPQDAGRDYGLSTHLHMMLCRMEAKGVMPMPVPMSTACSEAKILRVGVPYGPST